MSEIFTAPSVETPRGSFYQMSKETRMLQHLDRKNRILGEEDVIDATAHVTEHKNRIKTLYAVTSVSGVGAVLLAFGNPLSYVAGLSAAIIAGSAFIHSARRSVYAEIKIEGLENGEQSIYLAEPEDAYQLADIINNFSAAEETSFLSE